jgi:hypothetical protein
MNFLYLDKPKKFKFVEQPMIYSCSVHVCLTNVTYDNVELKFKLNSETRTLLDYSWMDDYLYSLFKRNINYQVGTFKLDNAYMAFLHKIFITEKEYKTYIRTIKLNRILEYCDKMSVK